MEDFISNEALFISCSSKLLKIIFSVLLTSIVENSSVENFASLQIISIPFLRPPLLTVSRNFNLQQ